MKFFLKILRYLIFAIIVLVVVGFSYLKFFLPNAGDAPELKIAHTAQQIERGRYLATHVSVCVDCHSIRDWTMFSGPPKPETIGMGGDKFEGSGLPGVFYSRNITPSGIGDWTDGEIYRAMTAGVDRNGEPLFPIMPWDQFGHMANDDAEAIIAYIRTLPAKENSVPKSEVSFPMNLIMRTMPRKGTPKERPPVNQKAKYGEYMARISGCILCHTPQDHGTPLEGMHLAGGWDFLLPDGGIVNSANITPHKETGIGLWSEEAFLLKFKNYSNPDINLKVEPGGKQTVMPWIMYSGMEERDLRAIYQYLMSQKPVEHQVERYPPKEDS